MLHFIFATKKINLVENKFFFKSKKTVLLNFIKIKTKKEKVLKTCSFRLQLVLIVIILII